MNSTPYLTVSAAGTALALLTAFVLAAVSSQLLTVVGVFITLLMAAGIGFVVMHRYYSLFSSDHPTDTLPYGTVVGAAIGVLFTGAATVVLSSSSILVTDLSSVAIIGWSILFAGALFAAAFSVDRTHSRMTPADSTPDPSMMKPGDIEQFLRSDISQDELDTLWETVTADNEENSETDSQSHRGGSYSSKQTPPTHINSNRTRWRDRSPNTMTSHTPPSTDRSTQPNTGRNREQTFAWTHETAVTMEMVGGFSEIIAKLDRDIITPLTGDRDRTEKFSIPLPNLLLYGPPGTGKTHLARALSNELSYPTARLSGADITSEWMNKSPQLIKQLFSEARPIAETNGGAIIFVDELDSVLPARDGRMHEENRKVVNELLSQLSETTDTNVLFIGATNRFEDLDSAAIRNGRIDLKLEIGTPNESGRIEILSTLLADRPSDLTQMELETIATETAGAVAADIEALVIDAARIAAYETESDEITFAHFDRALSERSNELL